MPKVVIELQANTQEAVNKIQQFARAQKDAFDAVKAGNPALQDAWVKVSKLSDSTRTATQVTGEFNRATKSLAQGGLRELAGGIPVVGDALTALAGTLKGFPAIMLGVLGTGAAFLAYLKSVEAQAGRTAAAIAQVGLGIQAQTLAMAARVGGIRAGATGDLAGAAAGEFRATEIEANAAKQQALDAAAAKRAGAIGLGDRALGLLNPQALLDKQKLADAEYQAARAKAEADANEKITLAREQLKATFIKIDDDLTKKGAENQEQRVKDAKEAAEKQTKLLEDLASKSLSIFKGLGADFKDATHALELAQFVKDSTAAIDTLKQAFENGVIKQDAYTQGTQALTEKMQEAIRLGYVPVAKAVEEVAAVQEEAIDSAARWRQEIADTMPFLDDLIKKGAEIQAQAGGGAAAAAGAAGMSSVQTAMPALAFSAGSGGVGSAVRPEGGGGVRIEAGAVQITGTVIQQQRDWDTLVDTLGQSLAARGR